MKAKDIHLIYERKRAIADVKVLSVPPKTEGSGAEKVSHGHDKKGTTIVYCIEGTAEIYITTTHGAGEKDLKEKPDFVLKAGETFEANLIRDSFLGLNFFNMASSPCQLVVLEMIVKDQGGPVTAPTPTEAAKALLEEGEDNSFAYDSSATWKIWTVGEEKTQKSPGTTLPPPPHHSNSNTPHTLSLPLPLLHLLVNFVF